MNEEAKIVEILRLFGELQTINKTYVSDLLANTILPYGSITESVGIPSNHNVPFLEFSEDVKN